MTDVMVFVSHGSEKRKCRLRDISLSGAFIETENFALAKGTKLDLVLRILREEKTTACPLPAEVVRVQKDGAALCVCTRSNSAREQPRPFGSRSTAIT